MRNYNFKSLGVTITVCCWFIFGVLGNSVTVSAAAPHSIGTVPFIFDDNRVFVYLTFVRADGTSRQALAFVDLGTPILEINENLGHNLRWNPGSPVRFRIGELEIQVPPTQVQASNESSFTGPKGKATVQVEAVLPGSVLKDYQVVFDYGKQTLTVARPGTLSPRGIPLACRVNQKTGLISVDVSVAGQTYKFAVDPGSAYLWMREDVAQDWVKAHPDWQRGTGAIGEANMQTRTGGAEAQASVLRLPQVIMSSIKLKQVGAVGIDMTAPPFPPVPGDSMINGSFFDWYSKKAPEPVIGWIGGNVLKAFRVTIDFANHLTYWEQQRDIDVHDFDQVGVTLETRDNVSGYFVAGIAQKNGKPTAAGVQVGDKLIEVDGISIANATRGGIFAALHGAPGTTHTLTLKRNGELVSVPVQTTSF
jgi:hypothetical protein